MVFYETISCIYIMDAPSVSTMSKERERGRNWSACHSPAHHCLQLPVMRHTVHMFLHFLWVNIKCWVLFKRRNIEIMSGELTVLKVAIRHTSQ